MPYFAEPLSLLLFNGSCTRVQPELIGYPTAVGQVFNSR